jgi:hypothetical protein
MYMDVRNAGVEGSFAGLHFLHSRRPWRSQRMSGMGAEIWCDNSASVHPEPVEGILYSRT